jgi:hypothetical protein
MLIRQVDLFQMSTSGPRGCSDCISVGQSLSSRPSRPGEWHSVVMFGDAERSVSYATSTMTAIK